MTAWLRNTIVIAALIFAACVGLTLSLSAPYIRSGDELVYLAGALQVHEGNLPDARMLSGYDDGPYLYPKVLLWAQGAMGPEQFKIAYLVVIVMATGLAAYGMFRLVWLPWVPAVLFSLVALMPRFSAGLEIFGVFTFRDAIGRACAYPLFFLGTGLLIRRFAEQKSLWPVFGICGICMFLHPVTVILFAFASLIAVAVARLVTHTPVLTAMREVFISGVVFLLGGSYFFIEVARRLAHGISSQGVSSAEYVEAVVFRNLFDFPAGSLAWYPHMATVSIFFIALGVGFYILPKLRTIQARHTFSHTRLVVVWGLTLAAAALVLSPLVPGVNLYLMEHADAPYIFQQWSRIAKFYYLGIFVALVPTVYTLWQWYCASTWRFRHAALIVCVMCGVLSSSVGLEIAEFAAGYNNFDKGYIPQALSGIPDEITPSEYEEVCSMLQSLGSGLTPAVLSPDFALRYYCRADLYVTTEEGAAYQQLSRAEVVDWYERLRAQRAALTSADPHEIVRFAKKVGAHFIVLSKDKASMFDGVARYTLTSRHVIVEVGQ